jgi:aminoglycoside phosphotransferase (APT) family kinase protein
VSFEADAIVELGRGTDSVAYLVGGEWVFRFPVAEDAQETLRRELALLPALGPSLPLDIPVFERVGREQGRLLFAGYRVLPGAPLTAERFNGLGSGAQEAVLSSLVGFLEALHAFPSAPRGKPASSRSAAKAPTTISSAGYTTSSPICSRRQRSPTSTASSGTTNATTFRKS